MKKGIQILLVLVMVISIVGISIVGCAKEAETPGAPTRISPQVPAQTTPATPKTPATPTTPAKPAAAPAAEVYKWRMQSHTAPAEPNFTITIANYIQRIEESSGGRIDIEVYSAGALVPSTEIIPSVAKGLIEMGGSAASYSSGIMPVVYTTLIPMGPRSAEDCAMIWYKGWGDILRKAYDEKGDVKLLTMAIMTDIPLYSTKPVRTVEDFKGMKIRTHGATALLCEQLGAATTYIPGEEVYMALSTGTVDAATWGGFATTYPKKWYEIANYIILPALVPMFQQQDFIINKGIWSNLPADLQSIIQSSADLLMWDCRMTEAMGNDEALEAMLAAGNEIITLPADSVAEMTEAAKVVWDDLATRDQDSYDSMKIVTDYLRLQGYTDYVIEDRNIQVKS